MKSVLLATAAFAALAAGNAWAAAPTVMTSNGAHPHRGAHLPVNRALNILYDQSGDDSGNALVAQNFESTFNAYDTEGADDFTVPPFAKWYLNEVDVTGAYFNGSGLAPSVNVIIYYHAKGKSADRNKPGLIKAEFDNLVPADNGFGSFAITLPHAVHMRAGTYWVSVQANLDFFSGGEWGWEISNAAPENIWPAVWRNPNGGFATGCSDWGTNAACVGYDGDYLFVLRGTQIGGK